MHRGCQTTDSGNSSTTNEVDECMEYKDLAYTIAKFNEHGAEEIHEHGAEQLYELPEASHNPPELHGLP